jgi:hypothetical protein
MFGDDPLDAGAVAASIVRSAARPMDWLEQAYRLKRLADELIERWHEATRIGFEAQADHYRRFPVEWRFELDLKPGDIVPIRPGERESELRVRAVQGLVAHGSPEVYMMLAGQAVENLVKGLYVREHPEVVRSAEQVANGGSVLAPPANSHGTLHLMGPDRLGINLSEKERNIARRLELAVRWHGRYPIPTKADQSRVDPLDDHEESNRLGFWSSTFRAHVDALYARFFAELVEPGWFPYWEPDKFPSY